MYRIRIKPLDIENIMDTLIKEPFFTTKDNVLVRRVGIELRELRKDKRLIIANDRKTGLSVLALKKNPLSLGGASKMKGKRCTYDFPDDFFL